MTFLYGMVAALGWGTGDFLARTAVQRLGAYRTLFWVQMPGIALLVAFLGLTGQFAPLREATPSQWTWAAGAAVLNVFSTLALYRAFATGMLSIAAPLTASYAAVTTLLSLLSGERISPLQFGGIAFCLGGAALVAASRNEEAAPSMRHGSGAAVLWSLVAALGFGVTFWLFGAFVTPPLSGAPSVLVARVGGVATLGLLALPLRRKLPPPDQGSLPILLAVSLFDTIAFVANNVGLQGSEDALVSVLASQFSAVTVLLARIFLNERLHPHQVAGVLLVLVGVALLGWKG